MLSKLLKQASPQHLLQTVLLSPLNASLTEAVQTGANPIAKQLQGLQLRGIRRCDFDCNFLCQGP